MVTDLLGRGLEHVTAKPAESWLLVFRDWYAFTGQEIDGLVATLDEEELRILSAYLLRQVTELLRNDLLEEAFPGFSASDN